MRFIPSLVASAICLHFSALAAANPTDTSVANTQAEPSSAIERIRVHGDFRKQSVQQLAGSVAVLTAQDVKRTSAQHLDDVMQQLANVNFAAGASRGRFIQIRGIGERSQFVDTINPSVGILIDGIDYSGLGVSSISDMAQLEVFRGPEATRFGANALAGMLNLTTIEPTNTAEARLSATVANYNSQQLAGHYSNAINEQWGYSVAAEQQSSDGFIENRYLNRDDTNNIEEFTGRVKLRYQPSALLALQLVGHFIDQDNGYDAFSLDRNRTTLSDEPGQDQLRSEALALQADYQGLNFADFNAQLSWLRANADYSFDEDWSYVGIRPGWEYSYADRYLRTRDSLTLDYRLVSKEIGRVEGIADWTAGFYLSSKEFELQRLRRKEESFGQFDSSLLRENWAMYVETNAELTEALTLVLGGRIEYYEDNYSDSAAINLHHQSKMWGAKLSLNYQVNDQALLYGLVSRGYKVGGINGEALSQADQDGFEVLLKKAQFKPETLINAEFGVKGSALDGSMIAKVSAFYMWRDDMQVTAWLKPDAEHDFIGYLDNASSGRNYGIEMENRITVTPDWTVLISAGWLRSKLGSYRTTDLDLTGREQAHAPRLTYSITSEYFLTAKLKIDAALLGKTKFYYSDDHNARSSSYELLNMRLSYQLNQWELSAWTRNALDQDVAVRGFYFGNDPRDGYQPHTYEQLTEPRRFGVTASYQF